MRLRLDLGYDGTAFHGWARQPGQRTVQGEVERALVIVLRRPVAVVVAGRTDAGVHARGQVCHVDLLPLREQDEVDLLAQRGQVDSPAHDPAGGRADLSTEHAYRDDGEPVRLDPMAVPARHPASPPPPPPPPVVVDISLLRRLNGVLPPDVRVLAVAEAPPGFNARFSATWRRYAYRVSDGVVDPLRRHDTLAYPRALDLDRLRAACPPLLGLRDFAAFCKKREGATTIRTLQHLDFRADSDSARYGALVMDVRADAFCHSMVRALVGALLLVGDGRREPDWPAQVLAGRERRSDSPVAPAHGLVLEQVGYPDVADLAARGQVTRKPRDLTEFL